MKKATMRGVISLVIVLALYHLIVFVVPFFRGVTFWISYGFTMAAFVVVAASFYIAFLKNPDAKSRFYGFPIARIGIIYGTVQLLVSLAVMALTCLIPWWIPVVVYAIGLGVAAIGLISAEAVVDEIRTQDHKLKAETSLMRTLQSKISQIAGQSENAALRALAEEFRYSDPVSSDAIADAEADLAAAVDQLQAAFVDGDSDVMDQLCRKVSVLLSERNRLCKLNKN